MQLKEKWNRFGTLRTVHSAAYAFAKRCLVLDVTHLMILDVATVPEAEDSSVEFRALGYEEALQWQACADVELGPAMLERLRGELDICFAAWVDGELAGYYWLARDSIEAKHNRGGSPLSGVALSFPDSCAFAYAAFVRPQFRGQGIYTHLVWAAVRWMHRQYATGHLISTADWTNYSALRSCERQGLRSIGRIWRFGWPCCMKTIGPRAARECGILIGPAAHVTDRNTEVNKGMKQAQ